MPTKRTAMDRDVRPYHHGDLRAGLVRAAVEILRKEGPDGLTLRAVARAAGVSQAAPYRHFADRRALVAAVAETGFRKLGAKMQRRLAGQSGRNALRELAYAYVEFARANEAEYRVMFGREAAVRNEPPSLGETARGVLGLVRGGIEQLQRAGLVRPGDAGMLAVVTWASLHGLVMLMLDGQTTGVAPSIDGLLQTATDVIMFGLAPRI